jgi:hypothetical protein
MQGGYHKAYRFFKKCLPEKCVITFFRKELDQFVSEHNLPIIGYLHSEVLDIPIYDYQSENGHLCRLIVSLQPQSVSFAAVFSFSATRTRHCIPAG